MIKDMLIDKIVKSEKMFDTLFEKQGFIYTFLNPVSYLDAQKNKDLFDNIDGIFVDGNILVSFIKLFYHENIVRRSFDMTSMAPILFNYASKNGKSVYIIASKQESIEKSINVLKIQYPNLNFCGYRNGFFSNEEDRKEEISNIVRMSPDFLIVGMGVGKQEEFLLDVKNEGFNGIGFSCGGFIHQMAHSKQYYYPKWVDKHDLRFLYRMYKEKHTRKRYLKAAFLFPIVFFKEKFFS